MNKNTFIEEVNKLNIDITEDELKKLDLYGEKLQEYNKKFNLTAITETESIYLKHFYDSLCLTKAIDLTKIKNICDFGTGAGFPGMVIAIFFKDLKVYLIESNKKKCEFLSMIKELLNLDNVSVINERAEKYSKENREQFDAVTCRAVSHLQIVLELAVPMLKTNGLFVPLKGQIEEELNDSQKMLDELSTTLIEVKNYKLPIENSERNIPIIKKEKATKEIYPREYNKIIKEVKREKNK